MFGIRGGDIRRGESAGRANPSRSPDSFVQEDERHRRSCDMTHFTFFVMPLIVGVAIVLDMLDLWPKVH
jgi:hypothetical protein